MQKPQTLLDAAERIVQVLREHQVDAVVIGAVAMAAHRYVRFTHDIDLGVNADVKTMRALAASLGAAGFKVEFREPDGQDPLGGVMDITGSFGLVQVVSFAERFPAVIDDATQAPAMALRPGSPLKPAPLPQLIALKLYAGGLKSKSDIAELLTLNPEADLQAIRATCNRYRLQGLDEILHEIT